MLPDTDSLCLSGPMSQSLSNPLLFILHVQVSNEIRNVVGFSHYNSSVLVYRDSNLLSPPVRSHFILNSLLRHPPILDQFPLPVKSKRYLTPFFLLEINLILDAAGLDFAFQVLGAHEDVLSTFSMQTHKTE